ncbi:STAS domain-containing protein [Streptomyces sp. H39-S7]|uniref:STAS domain-containing protein n=1 Tax=Streptomyces sp. H39-S7 TaxID=3004357 RepID=UPI0022AE723B|nr:STAS domain-containing protein [Streptomyces sp. H39-S7]MCZ4117810.1 STAS domain-containing protein [Streptomyces sp. H39-S7]
MTITSEQPVQQRRCQIVKLRGELDLDTVPSFGTVLRRACADPLRPELVVDLRAVTFMDCTALRELCTARAKCVSAGGWLRLVYDAPDIRRLFDTVEMTTIFPPYATIADACCHWPPHPLGYVRLVLGYRRLRR